MENNLGPSGVLLSFASVLYPEYHLGQSVSVAWELKYTLQNLHRDVVGARGGCERNFIHSLQVPVAHNFRMATCG